MYFLHRSLPPLNSTLDYISLTFVVTLLFLSLLSISFIFYLCVRSRSSRHLQHFNSLWAVRFLFILFITLWSINFFLRIPFVSWRNLFPFLSPLSLPQQAKLCTTYVVLSLGLFEPGFLVTLLYLLNVSVNKTTPWFSEALWFVFASCLPVLILQLSFVVYPCIQLPEVFYRTFVVVKNPLEEKETALCAYPLMGTFVFTAFGVVYSVSFVVSCWKLLSVVINKALRIRIYALAITVLVTLPSEIIFLGLSVLWTPERTCFGLSAFAVFFSTLVCAAVGEGVLVIRPISDSLAVERQILQPRLGQPTDEENCV